MLGSWDTMIIRYVAGLIASVAFLAASYVTPVRAQSPGSTTTYLSLLSNGFEVKSVILIFNDESTRQDHSSPVGTVVTLQKGAVMTRCWMMYATYSNGDTRDREGRLLPMNCY
jgi:hypothetical protein